MQKKVPPKNPPTFSDSFFANDSFFSPPSTSSITPAAPNTQPIVTPPPPSTSAPVPEEKQQIEEEISKQNLYKTELCRSFRDTGACRYGHKCQFAHGEHELRPLLRHPKYKTEICKTFATTAHCPYGNRCRFIHTDANGRIITLPPPSTNQVNNASGSVSIPNSTCEDEDFSQSQIYPNQYPPKVFHSSSPQQNTPASSPKSHTSPFTGVQFQTLDKNSCGFKSSKSGWGVNVTQVEIDNQSPEEKERENDSPDEKEDSTRRLAVFQKFTV